MSITSLVGRDGTAILRLDSREIKIRAQTVESARQQVIEKSLDYAATTATMQVLTATDPSGEWVMHVYPTGEVVAAPAPAAPTPPLVRTRPPLEGDYDFDGIAQTMLTQRRHVRSALILSLDNGDSVTVEAPVILGRNPVSRRGHTSLPLASPGKEVSRTHAVLDIDARGIPFITDEGAVNGTTVNGVSVQAHHATPVYEGSRIELGDVVLYVRLAPIVAL